MKAKFKKMKDKKERRFEMGREVKENREKGKEEDLFERKREKKKKI